MANYINISRTGYTWYIKRDLTVEEQKNSWRRQKTITEKQSIVQAKVISKHLALFQYHKATMYDDSRYHVIHIPTGLVIADITYDMVKDVKDTFENMKWIIKDNTFTSFESIVKFEMTCKIRYTVEKE